MSYLHLTTGDRKVIFYLKMVGKSQAEIGATLGRHPSTISRELKRNSGYGGQYLPDVAGTKAKARERARIHRPKTGDDKLMAHVAERLARRGSPEQIAGRLAEIGSADLPDIRISHQTIYRWIWADPRRAERFRPFLRVAHRKRRKPYGKPSQRGQIPNRVSIEQRPAEVADRKRLGDWEADTVVGKGRSAYVATCVDRASRYTVARKLRAPTAQAMNAALHDAMRRLPKELRRTLTVDNGREFTWHERLGQLLTLQVYFAHPYHAWERGTNENLNGLLRQYLPKGMDITQLTNWELESYIRQLNERPRKCLNYRTPAEVFWRRSVALTM